MDYILRSLEKKSHPSIKCNKVLTLNLEIRIVLFQTKYLRNSKVLKAFVRIQFYNEQKLINFELHNSIMSKQIYTQSMLKSSTYKIVKKWR
jgi:hypothetical protein